MVIIGVSGFIGSGKTTLLNYLRDKYGVVVIEADVVSKEVIYHPSVLNFLKYKIPNALRNNSQINRKELRRVVFTKPDLNDEFTSIIWPLISDNIKNQLQTKYKEEKVVVIEAAIINGLSLNFDITILLQKEEEKRIENVMERDARDLDEIKSISRYQKQKVEFVEFDYILENNSNLEVFYDDIDCLAETIKKRINEKKLQNSD